VTDNQSGENGAGESLLRRFGRFTLRWAKRLAIFGLSFYLVTQVIFAGLNYYDRTWGMPTYEGPPIPYKLLATEKSHPFPARRGALREQNSQSIQKFPGVRSCLVMSEKTAKMPDLRKVDWQRIYSTEDVSVCIFWIFSSISSVEGVTAWADSYGLKTKIGKVNREIMHIYGENKEGILVQLDWNVESIGLKFPAWGWGRIWYELILRGLVTNIVWSIDENIVRIDTKLSVVLFLMS